MNAYLEILLFALAGIAGVFAHAFKAVDDKNKAQEDEYTFAMYWKKNRYIMYFVWICVIFFAIYNNEWKAFEKLGNWRGLIMLGMGYIGDSAFPSLFSIIPLIIEKVKSTLGGKKDGDAS